MASDSKRFCLGGTLMTFYIGLIGLLLAINGSTTQCFVLSRKTFRDGFGALEIIRK